MLPRDLTVLMLLAEIPHLQLAATISWSIVTVMLPSEPDVHVWFGMDISL